MVDLALRWTVVLSAKRLDRAKTRLAQLGDNIRRSIAIAMLEDVIAAVVRAARVSRVVVVCSDPVLVRLAAEYGVDVVPDRGDGLNAAFRQGVWRVGGSGARVAMLPTDLPCLTPKIVDEVLVAASCHGRAVVPDLDGRGTTVLTAAPGYPAEPRFGDGSFPRHVAGGARRIATELAPVRCDVDTPADLRTALQIGAGSRTRATAARLVELDEMPLTSRAPDVGTERIEPGFDCEFLLAGHEAPMRSRISKAGKEGGR